MLLDNFLFTRLSFVFSLSSFQMKGDNEHNEKEVSEMFHLISPQIRQRKEIDVDKKSEARQTEGHQMAI